MPAKRPPNWPLAVVFVGLLVDGGRSFGKTPPDADLTSLPPEELIARFQEVSAQSVGANSVMTMGGFVAIDAPLQFEVGLLGVPPPTVPPVMRELVRRGLGAVPALLAHLTDARPTKLSIGSKDDRPMMGGTFYGKEYDPKKRPVLTPEEKDDAERKLFANQESVTLPYQVKVGDLCYATLGQIVNRSLLAMRYQPTAIVIINSPVHSPELADKARKDWGGVTAEAFKDFLIADAETRDERPSTPAVQRLLFYYPEAGRAMAVRLVNRPVCDGTAVYNLIYGPLLSAREAEQDRLLTAFRAAPGGEENYRALVQALVAAAGTPLDPADAKSDPDQAARHENAVKLVKRRFGDVEKHPRETELDVDCYQQSDLIVALDAFPDPVIDEAVRGLLKRTLALQPQDPRERLSQCRLAGACAQHFASPDGKEKLSRAFDRLCKIGPPAGKSHPWDKEKFERCCQEFLRASFEKSSKPAAGVFGVAPRVRVAVR